MGHRALSSVARTDEHGKFTIGPLKEGAYTLGVAGLGKIVVRISRARDRELGGQEATWSIILTSGGCAIFSAVSD